MTKKHFITFLSLILIGIAGFGQQKADTLKVLFVGNSYTYMSNIPHLVSLISDHTSTKLITAKSVAGGANLSQHWNGDRGLKSKEKIASGNYDIVVIQDHSMSSIVQPDSLLHYVKLFSDLAKKHGTKPYLYVTWPREKVPQYYSTIRSVYSQAAEVNNTGIVYVGDVWMEAKKIRPTVELYKEDGSHQSDLGAFLNACKFVKDLTGELPDELPNYYDWIDQNGEWIGLLELDRLDVTFCTKVVNGSH